MEWNEILYAQGYKSFTAAFDAMISDIAECLLDDGRCRVFRYTAVNGKTRYGITEKVY